MGRGGETEGFREEFGIAVGKLETRGGTVSTRVRFAVRRDGGCETRVRLLPTPLYVAYAQLKHAQQNGEDARVEILGSTDDAEAFARRPTSEEGEIATEGGEETDNRRHNKRRRGEGVEDAVGAAVGRFPGCTRNTAASSFASATFESFSPTSSSSTSSSPTRAAARGATVERAAARFSMNCLRTTRAKRRRITPISPSPPDFSFDASCSRYNAKPYAWAQNWRA